MDDKPNPRTHGRIWTGLFLLLIGGVLLLDQMGFPLPGWLFNWPMLLIAIGIFVGIRHNFRGGVWLILIVIGCFNIISDYYPDIHLHRFMVPGILILVGIMIVLNPNRTHKRWKHRWRDDWKKDRWEERFSNRWGGGGGGVSGGGGGGGLPGNPSGFSSSREGYSSEDFIDATTVFGGIHKKIVSKTFKGGDIVTMMGGTELDLTQADFTGIVRLDVTQIMGGTKIIVPAHWEVRSEVTAIFAGFEDKRQQPTVTNPEKVLVIEGTSIFGGIELRNF